MLAYKASRYGNSNVLTLVDIPIPTPYNTDILIKNIYTSVNSADSRLRRADPFFVRFIFGFKALKYIPGVVFSGYAYNGKEKKRVCGMNFSTFGGFAQYLVIPIQNAPHALLPDELSFKDASALVFGGHTALHFLKKAQIKKGDSILIYGASGSVGVAAIQLARYYGATVTAVCSTKHRDMINALGVSSTIDYTQTRLRDITQKFDIVFDTVGKGNEFELQSLVKPRGTLILGSAIIKGSLIGLLLRLITRKTIIFGTAETTSEELSFLFDLCVKGYITPVIDSEFQFNEMIQANTYVDEGHKRGNVVVKIQEEE